MNLNRINEKVLYTVTLARSHSASRRPIIKKILPLSILKLHVGALLDVT